MSGEGSALWLARKQGSDLYSGALWAIDWQRGYYAQSGIRQASQTTVAGYTGSGVQNITSAGLLCDANGCAELTTPAWPTGDWAFVFAASGLGPGTGSGEGLFSLRSAGSFDPEFFAYTYNSGTNANIKELVSAVSAFDTLLVAGGQTTPLRVAISKSGTAVRASANGGAAFSLGAWIAFTPTRLGLGVRGDTEEFRLGARVSAAVLYGTAKSDAAIVALSAGGTT